MATSQPERTPRRFDPRNLTRSVIALPLLEKIERERELTEGIVKSHPHIRETHNAAIFLRRDFPGGVSAALKVVRELLAIAVKKLGTKKKLTIDEPDPTISDRVALAWLDDAIIRQLLGLDAMQSPGAIESIWPARIEIIIDLNLGFRPVETRARGSAFKEVDPRQIARALIKKYVEKVMKAAGHRLPPRGG
jgi:hypothetical protein